RNTARVQAGAAERRRVVLVQPGVDAGGLAAELRGADRGRITGGSAADDHDVVIFAHEDPCWRGYCSRANPRAEPISAASIPAVEATVEAAERLAVSEEAAAQRHRRDVRERVPVAQAIGELVRAEGCLGEVGRVVVGDVDEATIR